MEHKQDIFDKIFSWRILRFAQPFYQKHKEVLLYLFFGALTTAVSIGTFYLFTKVVPLDALVANILSWIFAVSFAFFTNRTWVFQADDQPFFRQMFSFFLGRLSTLLMEECILLVFVTWLQLDSMVIKIAAQVLVLVMNYVVSKLFVFKK